MQKLFENWRKFTRLNEKRYIIPVDPKDPAKGTVETEVEPNINPWFYTSAEVNDLYEKGYRLIAPVGLDPDIFATAVERLKAFESAGPIYKKGPNSPRLVRARREREPEELAVVRRYGIEEPAVGVKPKKRRKRKRKRKKLRCKACFDWLITRILKSRFLVGGTTETLEGAILSGEVKNWIDEADALNLRVADQLRTIIDWGPAWRRKYYDRYNSGEGTYTREDFNKKRKEFKRKKWGRKPPFDPETIDY